MKLLFKRASILMTLFILCSPAFADDFEIGDLSYTKLTWETCYVSRCNESATSVTIPSEVRYDGNKYSVTSIGGRAFKGCIFLTSITIPSSVKSIESGAFSGCTGLTRITIPSSVTSIGDDAFWNCTGLTSITIPNSVTSIGDEAFWNCTGLTSITIPNSVEYIGSDAFYYCKGLTSITIPNSVEYIGSNAFSGCTGLTSIDIPNSVTSIEDGAFGGCRDLKQISVDSQNTTYDSRDNCNAIIETATNTLVAGCINTVIPNSVTDIGNYAFSGCTGLTSITIPNSVTSIGNYAFYKCKGLTSITIPNSVTSIGEDAFKYCSGLTSITIPNSVTSIGNRAFVGCTGLTSITIPNSVTSIGNNAFSSTGLTSITIPNSVTSIGEQAFFFSIGLTSITIPNSVTSIESGTFAICTGLTSITIPNSVTSIGNYAFYKCTGLTSITIPNSVTSIGNYAFYECKGLTSITIPCSVTSIEDYAFQNCTGLTSITIPNSVTSIGVLAFSGCTSLDNIIVQAQVPPTCSSDAFNHIDKSQCTLYVPDASIEAYQDSSTWKDFNIKALSETCFVTNITFDKESVSLKPAETATITATISPDDADNKKLVWKSKDENIATVSTSGVITGVGVGETDITATAADGSGVKAVCHIIVVPTLAASIEMSATTLRVKKNHTASLSATVLPSTTTNKTLVWTSSNPNIATVDEEGNIKALLAGNTVIKATAADGSGVFAECNLTVTAPITGDSNDDDAVNIVDAVNTVNYILDKVTGAFVFEAADVNSDGSITVSDVTGTTSLIMAQSVGAKKWTTSKAMRANRIAGDADDLVFSQKDNTSLGIALDNASDYVALQADITLPVHVKNVTIKLNNAMASTHRLTSAKVDDNTLRIAVYSLSNKALAPGTEIFSISADKTFDAGEVEITNAMAADAEAAGFILNSRFNNATSIHSNGTDKNVVVKPVKGGVLVSCDTDTQVSIRTTGGVLVKDFRLAAGSCKVDLVRGIYLVTIDGQTTKITVK